MKVIIAILILGLCGSIYANQAVFQELAQINENPFGATVLAALATNMKVKTPLEDISLLLQEILRDLESDESALDTQYNNRKESLNNAISSNTQIRNDFQRSVDTLVDSIRTDKQSRDAKQITYNDILESIRLAEQRIRDLQDAYNVYIPNIDADIEDLRLAIEACQQAIAKMQTYQNAISTSLLQVASSAKKELKSFSTQMAGLQSKLAKHGSQYGPLIHELISLTENPETTKAGKIVSLLTQLKTLLEQAKSGLESDRFNYINNYNTQLGLANTDLTNFNNQEIEVSGELSTLNDRISRNELQLPTEQNLLAEAEKILQQNIDDLADLEEYYLVEAPKYDALIAIVKRIIAHFNDNISSVDEWTQQQINGF